ncbi:16872_t:CDS:2, partial [Acaulospora morrowiae]
DKIKKRKQEIHASFYKLLDNGIDDGKSVHDQKRKQTNKNLTSNTNKENKDICIEDVDNNENE